MSGDIKIFESKDFGKVEILIKNDGTELFKAKSIASILGYKDTDQAIRRHCKRSESYPVKMTGQVRYATFIPESDVYRLIVKSKLPSAEKFELWLFEEVLPTIRKTGGYVQKNRARDFVEMWLPELDDLHKDVIAGVIEKNQKLIIENKSMKPKAEYFDALVDTNLLTNFRDTAKELKIGQKQFINWLLERKYVYRNKSGKLLPYMRYVGKYFELKEWSNEHKSDVQTFITVKGKDRFRSLLKKNNNGNKSKSKKKRLL